MNLQHVNDMLALPRSPAQRWVYMNDESQVRTGLYPQYDGKNLCIDYFTYKVRFTKAISLGYYII